MIALPVDGEFANYSFGKCARLTQECQQVGVGFNQFLLVLGIAPIVESVEKIEADIARN